MRDANVKDYHIGRGGKGNERHDHATGEHEHDNLAHKLKNKIMGDK